MESEAKVAKKNTLNLSTWENLLHFSFVPKVNFFFLDRQMALGRKLSPINKNPEETSFKSA